ncbi:pyridine nucleotide-disulfide oxidoreductase [Natronospirillum operosum]|uniref:Pyridine nucleotide-disulfide oxidoreductase n=1 Tax=Natronospirillum operosum TaxID=2759953 RepID=A0A4Z0W9B5_9GAMM|nr:FAD-dependent oxidoreductase [Natronospirillum operosum]TGG91757.1 pyridine nucleotide-disulfide oxidoreductase [Natronospirillum operosum]
MKTKLLLLAVIVALFAAYWLLGLGQYFNLDFLQQQQTSFQTFYQNNQLLTISFYFVVYVAVAALSLPGATIMTLAGGAIFGLPLGLLIVSFASSIGATLAFLVSRFILRDSIEARFRKQFEAINAGVNKDGPFYLFTLRLVPIFPFFIINLLMGLTKMKTWTFYWVSQVGMLAGTAVYVNAGTQIAAIETVGDIGSPQLLLSFALLGIFPLIAKKTVDFMQARKVYKGFTRPRHFDNNLIVIGAGSGGLVSAYIAATVKAKVTLIEKNAMGGDCLNTGCVPSKALIRAGKVAKEMRHADRFGLKAVEPEVDFGAVMNHVHQAIKTIEPHDSVERYTGLGVNVIKGEAFIRSPWEVEVNGQTLTTRNIILATGARPLVPPIKGLDQVDYLTSDNLWDLKEQPKRLVVLGGGPIGSELTQAFARLGSQVTQVEMGERILPREDTEVSAHVQNVFTQEGIEVLTQHKATEVVVSNGQAELICEADGGEKRIPFDRILVAVGRQANVTGYGLEELGVEISARGTVAVDAYLRTNFPNIHAVGDVAGPYQFTHTAAHMAWFAAVNALFGKLKKFRVDYRVIPWATFTDPEVARVGLSEAEAKAQNIDYEVTRYGIDDLDRAIADGDAQGWVKVLTMPGKDKVIGATIVGTHAGDLLTEYVSAMKHGIGMNKILGTIHTYPTLSEANKFAAGEWKKARKPEQLLAWVGRFHGWMR